MPGKRKIYLRADGNSEIGMGHVTRSLALAEMLNDHYDCIFATRFLTATLEKQIQKVCTSVKELSKEGEKHFQEFLNSLSGNEIVVLDNYFFTTEFQRKIKEIGCSLVCIDDIPDKHFFADLIINHSLQLKPSDYSAEKYTRFALGTKYALLREPFLTMALSKRNIKNINSVFVSFGSAAPTHFTTSTISILSKILSIKRINLILSTNQIKNVIDELDHENKVRYYESLDARSMVETMLASDLAILPASTICMEAACIKMPIISGYYVDNQKRLYKGFHDNGLITGIGNINKFNFNCFVDLIEGFAAEVVSNIINVQSKYFDGESGFRLKNIIQDI